MKNIAFIGGGRITWLLLAALKNRAALPATILVTDPNPDRLDKIKKIAPALIECTRDNMQAASAAVIFISVHPPVIKEVSEQIRPMMKPETIIVSLAPVVTMQKLATLLNGTNRIVRMIPNAASLLHQGYNPVAFADGINASEKAELLQLFRHWGDAPEVAEQKLEAYAIVTAMGPTYFWPQWLKLQELGRQFGLSEAELKAAMPAMLTGAVTSLYQSGLSAIEVMDLIPVYPMKDHETKINEMFEQALVPLYKKLSGAAK